MKFPELKIIDQFTSNKQQESIYTVFIDWKEVDNYKIKSRKNWYNKYGIEKPSDIEKKALKQCIKEMDSNQLIEMIRDREKLKSNELTNNLLNNKCVSTITQIKLMEN